MERRGGNMLLSHRYFIQDYLVRIRNDLLLAKYNGICDYNPWQTVNLNPLVNRWGVMGYLGDLDDGRQNVVWKAVFITQKEG